MSDERFIYKCRRCGGLKQNMECGEGFGHSHLVNAIHEFSVGDIRPPPMHQVHACEDGGHGVADLVGCEPIKLDPPAEYLGSQDGADFEDQFGRFLDVVEQACKADWSSQAANGIVKAALKHHGRLM